MHKAVIAIAGAIFGFFVLPLFGFFGFVGFCVIWYALLKVEQ